MWLVLRAVGAGVERSYTLRLPCSGNLKLLAYPIMQGLVQRRWMPWMVL